MVLASYDDSLTIDPHTHRSICVARLALYYLQFIPNSEDNHIFWVAEVSIGESAARAVYRDDQKTLGRRLVPGRSLFADS